MKLVNARYGLNIELVENQVSCLVVEMPYVYRDIVEELYVQVHGEVGNFILSEGDKELKISKCVDLVIEPFSLSINSNKKYLSQLYHEMSEYVNDARYEEKCEVVGRLIQLVDDIDMALGYDIDFDLDVTMESILKAMHVQFCEKYEDLKGKIIQYISLVSALNIVSLIIFVNIKSYFMEWELEEIYKAAFGYKMALLLVEATEHGESKYEKSCILDKDLCIIEK